MCSNSFLSSAETKAFFCCCLHICLLFANVTSRSNIFSHLRDIPFQLDVYKRQLSNNPGRDTAADIVEFRMLSKSNVSQAVECLIQKSLLERRQDTKDRRRIHLSLTPKSKPITDDIETVRNHFRKQIFLGFTEEEEKQFAWFNERIAKNTKIELEGDEIA